MGDEPGALGVAGLMSAGALVSSVGAELAVNTSTDGRQVDPAVTGLTNGGFVVTWADLQSAPDDPSAAAVRGQVFEADGDKVGGAFLVNTKTSGTQHRPDVSSLPNGGFVVTWTDVDGSNAQIKAQRFDAAGAKVGGEVLVSTSNGYLYSDPKVTDLVNGGFVVSWQGGGEIRAQSFTAGGARVGGEFIVNTNVYADQGGAAPLYDGVDVTGLATGGYVITWEDRSDLSVRAQIYGASGAKVGGEFFIGLAASLPDVVGLANGDFVVSWISAGVTKDVRAQVYHDHGLKSGDELLVLSDPIATRLYTTVASLADGFVITWSDWDNGQPSRDVKAQAFSSDGDRIGDPFVVTSVTHLGLNPASAGLANGDVVMAWMFGDTTPAADIRAQIFSISDLPNTPPTIGGVAAGAVAEAGAHSATGSLTVADPDPGAAFTWTIQGSADGVYGGLSLDASGHWTYTLNPTLAAPLTGADHRTDSFTVKAEDRQGGHDLQSIVITVDGADGAAGGPFVATPGDDYFSGRPGVYAVSYALAAAGVTVNLARTDVQITGGSGQDRFKDIDNLTGSGFADSLTGNGGSNSLEGGAGNDTLLGGDGADILAGGDGDDRLESGGFKAAAFNAANGHSYLYFADDVSWYEALSRASALQMGDKTGYLATITSAQEESFIRTQLGTSIWIGATDVQTEGSWRWVTGPEAGTVFYVKGASSQPGYSGWFGAQPDDAWSGQDYAVSYGSSWDDADFGGDIRSIGYVVEFDGPPVTKEILDGNGGNDTLIGGAGVQALSGGEGADSLNGGLGDDTLDGGAGIDTAQFAGLKSAYVITRTGPGYTVSGPDGVDTLTGVEFAKFSDQTLDLGAPPNTPPVIAGPTTGSVTEGGELTAAGQLTATDPDPGAAFAWSIDGSAAGAYGSLALSTAGKWTYTLNPTLAAPLGASDHPVETFTVKVQDGQGGSDTESVKVTVNGAGLALKFNAANGHSYAFVSASVNWTEAQARAAAMMDDGRAGYLATITSASEQAFIDSAFGALGEVWIGANDAQTEGTWKWVTGPEAGTVFYVKGAVSQPGYSHWYSGEPNDAGGTQEYGTLRFGLNFWDDAFLSDQTGYLVEFGGSASPPNSPPVIAGPATGAVTEGGVLTATGQLTATDPDPGAAFTWTIDGSVAGAYGSLALDAAGRWTYTLNPALAAPLSDADHPVETFTVKVQDGQGGSDTQSVTVTVNGAGPPPPPGLIQYPSFPNASGLILSGSAQVASSSDGSVLRLAPAASYTLGSAFSRATVDLSSFSTTFSFRISNSTVGADGLTFVIAKAESGIGGNRFAGGELGYAGIGNSVAVEFDAATNGEYGDTSNNHIGIDINGSVRSVATANVGPDIDGGGLFRVWIDYTGTALEVRYALTDNRPAAAQLTRAMDLASIIGGTTGHAGFTAGNGLNYGNQDILNWTMSWGGARPANTPPTISGPTAGAVTEGAALIASGQLTATDPDAGAVFAWSLEGSGTGAYGSFAVDATGQWTYTASPALVAPLTGADHPTETFTVKVQDGQGGSDLQVVTVTVNGAGAPSLDQLFVATPGADAFDGGDGADTVTYAGAGAAVRVDLTRADAQNTFGSDRDTLITIENLVGSAFDDSLKGSAGANQLAGGAGADTVKGGAGDDVILGGAGDDILAGNGGIDTVSYAGAGAGVTVTLGLKTAQDTGGAGIDLVTGFENLTGSGFADSLTGDKGANALMSGDGDDALAGGAGADRLTGGGGADRYVFALLTDSTVKAGGQDIVVDFSHAQGDRIDLSTLDADTHDAGHSVFRLVSGGFTGHAGELIQSAEGGGYLLRGDVDGDGDTDFALFVQAAAALTAADFIFGTPPTIAGPSAGVVAEDGAASASGQLTATDPDVGAVFAWSLEGSGTGAYGTFAVDAGGRWTYTLDPALVDPLNTADHRTETFTVRVDDGQGGYDLQTVTITVDGADEPNTPPTITGPSTGAVAEDGAATATGQLTATDPDAGAVFAWSLEGAGTGAYGTFAVDAAGRWTYTLDPALAAPLTSADHPTETFTVKVEDGQGGSDLQTVTVTVQGADPVNPDQTFTATPGPDAFDGGAGVDTVSYAGAGAAVRVDLTRTDAQNTVGSDRDTLTGIENLVGSAFDDSLKGDAGANQLAGGGGADTVKGGLGNDVILGGAGDDVLAGNGGIDTVSYAGAAAGVTVSLALKTAQDTGGAGIDLVTGFEALTGSGFADSLTGDKTANALNGGDGDDALTGGAGADRLTGGAGADRFIYAALTDSTVKSGGQDVIVDFSHIEGDRIDLSALDADSGDAADSAFHLVAADFTHHAGELIQTAQAGGYLVRGDVNGDGATDFAVFVQTASALTAADFIL